MERFISAWAIILCSSLLWPEIPRAEYLCLSLIVGAILLFRQRLFLAGICCAICYFGWHASLYQQRVNAIAMSGANHTIEAQVLAVAKVPTHTKLSLKVISVDDLDMKLRLPFKVRLNWYRNTEMVEPGDRLEALVKLKPAWGSANQGGFNYGRWLLSKNVVGLGYIKQGRVIAKHRLLSRWQARLRENILSLPGGAVAYAMLVGDKQYMASELKLRWQTSGLGHLLAISGLHLGLVAAWGGIIGRLLMLLWPQRLQLLPLLFAIGLAGLYGYSANWPVSAMRAMVMLCIGLSVWQFALSWRPWQAWLMAFFVITLVWPFAIYGVGFWLSFLTMAWLLALLWFLGQRRFRLVWLQLGLTLGMLPMQQGFFGSLPFFSALLNLIAVPLFAWLVVPLLLLGCVLLLIFPVAAKWCFSVACFVLERMDALLVKLGQLTPLHANLPSHGWSLVLLAAVFFLVWLLCWRMLGLNRGVVVLGAALLLMLDRNDLSDRWRVHFVDVGQGLAVVVERRGHGLIYDTGARYLSGFEFAQAAILPLIDYLSIKEVDWLIVSHGDNDHAGGFATLARQFPMAEIRTGKDPRIQGGECAGTAVWQDLTLEFAQTNELTKNYNDSSCVLLIRDEAHSLLLTGDIEVDSEKLLLEQGLRGPVTVLSAPHHGSNSSSSQPWVNALQPQIVVFSAGAYNRFGFPKPSVVQRYREYGSDTLVTGWAGQIRVEMGVQPQVQSYRVDLAPFWYNHLIK